MPFNQNEKNIDLNNNNQNQDISESQASNYSLSALTHYGYYGIGYSYELYFNPTKFILNYLYPIASREGVAVAPAFSPFLVSLGYAPQIVVLGPHDKTALLRLFQYGEEENDTAAREPLDRVRHALGTVTIANMQGEKAYEQRKKIKQHLHNDIETYTETYRIFLNLFKNWDFHYTYQENIRFAVTNVVAKVVFGIPQVDIAYMKTLQEMSYALAHYEPTDARFKEASQHMQMIGDNIVKQYGKDIIKANKFIADQLQDDSSVEKLLEIKAGSSILVEGNLSNTIMIALERIMDDETIKSRLRKEFKSLDFATPSEKTFEEINKNVYLHQIYMEALRFVQSSVMIARKSSRITEWDIKNKEGESRHFSINAGSYFFAPVRAMGHDPNLWKNPEQFDPARFEGTKLNEFSLNNIFPFTTGKRMCPAASRFAKLVFKTAIAVTVLRNEFTLSAKMQPIPADSIHPTLEPPMQLESYKEAHATDIDLLEIQCLGRGLC
ncbi:cytochrome P450 [Legionella israelensis]|uniref:cytochrome P450 n=1 Tax=Legionella israelensis TaxID=454 RepID=UPI00117F82BD|nr:cytochrome P450 [Legionella israelensis]QDP72036.1 cytochrome P450 [Legionella israelensis]